MMFSRHTVAACLHAAFEPSEPNRKPIVKSRTLSDAMRRLGNEADELKEAATSPRPFRETLHDLLEHFAR